MVRNCKIQISKMNLLQSAYTIWHEFLNSIVQNSFTGSGFYYKNGIDCIGETESESDCN